MRLGIDLGGTKIEGVVMDDAGKELRRLRRSTPVSEGYDAVLLAVCALVNELEGSSVKGCRVGIGTPGAISRKTGAVKNSNTTHLNNRPFKSDLEARLGREVFMANDANCFALTEAVDGAAAGYGVVFGVILGTGVGGGLVINQRIHEGPNSIAGEWGHNVLEEGGPAGSCGRAGCVEAFLSGPALEREYRALGGEALRVPEIDARATGGETLAVEVMGLYVQRLGRALAGLLGVLDPDVVVFGGGLSNLEWIYERLPEAVGAYVFSDEVLTPFVRNLHGDSSGVRGAAMLSRSLGPGRES